MDVAKCLHDKFNRDDSHIPPVRTKGFKRHNLIKLFAEFGFKRGAEIGVAEGRFSAVMLKIIPDLHLLGVDPWTPDGEDKRSLMIGKRLADERCEQANELYTRYPNSCTHRGTSMDVVQTFEKESLDFIYIDGNHTFDFVMQDLIEWSKRVRPGGIIAGHDYYRFRWAGVVDAVDIYTRMHRVHEWYITDERTPTFFWVKQENKKGDRDE
jgi:SAM-dependent methyltransferase